jgi:hypothetical protein
VADGPVPHELALFTQDELAAGLSIRGSRESAAQVAAAVAAIAEADRPFFRWAFETVLLVSLVGPGVAARVRAYYGDDASIRTRIQRQQRWFERFVAGLPSEPGGVRYRVQDVVVDTRPDAPPNLARAYLPPRDGSGVDALALLSEAELAAGLGLVGSEENAREVAAAVYGIPAAEQVHFEWIDEVLMLVSCVSDELAARVRSGLASTAREAEEIARLQRAWRAHAASTPAKGRAFFDVESVVHDRRLPGDAPLP